MTYLTRILYNSPSCDKWGEHELDYILFFKDYNNKIIPQPNPDEIKVHLLDNASKLMIRINLEHIQQDSESINYNIFIL